MNKQNVKMVFLAVIAPLSKIGYVLDTQQHELSGWHNWARRRSQRIVGECATRRQALAKMKTALNDETL